MTVHQLVFQVCLTITPSIMERVEASEHTAASTLEDSMHQLTLQPACLKQYAAVPQQTPYNLGCWISNVRTLE